MAGRLAETGGPTNRAGAKRRPAGRRLAATAGSDQPHTKADAAGELAPHSEAHRFNRGGKCGGRAGKQRVLTWGDPAPGNRGGESAEAIVAMKPVKAGGAKGRTGQERPDRVADAAKQTAAWPQSGRCRHDGKHGDIRGQET